MSDRSRRRPSRSGSPRRGSLRLARDLAAACTLLVPAACDEPAPPPAASWPEGAVLAVAGEPVTAAEVDAVADRLTALEPEFTRPHLRRLALTNVVLQRAYARTEAADRGDEARAELLSRVSLLAEPDPEGAEREGTAVELGLETWLAALDAPAGEWSEPFEERGAWCSVRVLERDPSAPPSREVWRVEVVSVPFVRSRDTLLDRLLDAPLEVLDETWGELVPAGWRYRMHGEDER